MILAKEYDFSGCRYNPRDKSFVKNIEKGIPQFANYEGDDKNHTFAYVVTMYDKNSPMWAKEPEYFQRKIKSATVCHLAKGNAGSFTLEVQEILEGRNEEFNKLVVAYLADTGDIDYMMLINEITMFHSLTKEALGGDTHKDTYSTMQKLSDSIRSRTRVIFGSGEKDEIARVRIALYESAEKDRRKMNPEAIVDMLEKDGGFPGDWGRYGAKYQPDDLKYMPDDK